MRSVIHIRSLRSLISLSSDEPIPWHTLHKSCIQTETCVSPPLISDRISDGISLMLIFGCLKIPKPKSIDVDWDVWNFIWLGGKKVDQWRFAMAFSTFYQVGLCRVSAGGAAAWVAHFAHFLWTKTLHPQVENEPSCRETESSYSYKTSPYPAKRVPRKIIDSKIIRVGIC